MIWKWEGLSVFPFFKFQFKLSPAGCLLRQILAMAGDTEAEQANRLLTVVVDFLHQLFGQRQNVILRAKDMVCGDAANLLAYFFIFREMRIDDNQLWTEPFCHLY